MFFVSLFSLSIKISENNKYILKNPQIYVKPKDSCDSKTFVKISKEAKIISHTKQKKVEEVIEEDEELGSNEYSDSSDHKVSYYLKVF